MCCHGNAGSSRHWHKTPFLPLFSHAENQSEDSLPQVLWKAHGHPQPSGHPSPWVRWWVGVAAALIPMARLWHWAPAATPQHQVCHWDTCSFH